uniref:Uncharacterized protein n=1 Tax=Sparus aurata TaxID=8175 RepID=A0A671Y0Q9_SPAAU
MSAQQKRSDQLLQQALAGAETQKAKKKILKKQCEDMKESLTETQKVLAETKEILAETKESLIKANETLTETEEALKETKESLDKANNRIDQVESQLRTQEDEYAKLQDKCSDLKQVLNAQGIEFDKIEYELKEVTRRADHTSRELESATAQIQDLKLKLQVWEKARENERQLHHDTHEELKEARDQLNDLHHEKREKEIELDKVKRELEHSLEDLDDRVKRSSSPQPFSSSRAYHPRAPSDRDLDKIFYLRRFPDATVEDRLYLIRGTSSQKVNKFIDRQTQRVKSNYEVLSKALIDEFKSYTVKTGLTAALSVKQGRQESPQEYYERLHEAYFGPKNETEMEEELHFKSLFVQNLHPTTSHHLGVMACPDTLNSRQLREMATKGFNKQKQALIKSTETNILSVSSKTPPLELEGAPGAESREPATTSSKSYQPPTEREYTRSDSGQKYSQKPRSMRMRLLPLKARQSFKGNHLSATSWVTSKKKGLHKNFTFLLYLRTNSNMKHSLTQVQM